MRTGISKYYDLRGKPDTWAKMLETPNNFQITMTMFRRAIELHPCDFKAEIERRRDLWDAPAGELQPLSPLRVHMHTCLVSLLVSMPRADSSDSF